MISSIFHLADRIGLQRNRMRLGVALVIPQMVAGAAVLSSAADTIVHRGAEAANYATVLIGEERHADFSLVMDGLDEDLVCWCLHRNFLKNADVEQPADGNAPTNQGKV